MESEVNWKQIASLNVKTCTSQWRDTAEDCQGIQLNSQYFEIVEKLCYIWDTIAARGGISVLKQGLGLDEVSSKI